MLKTCGHAMVLLLRLHREPRGHVLAVFWPDRDSGIIVSPITEKIRIYEILPLRYAAEALSTMLQTDSAPGLRQSGFGDYGGFYSVQDLSSSVPVSETKSPRRFHGGESCGGCHLAVWMISGGLQAVLLCGSSHQIRKYRSRKSTASTYMSGVTFLPFPASRWNTV